MEPDPQEPLVAHVTPPSCRTSPGTPSTQMKTTTSVVISRTKGHYSHKTSLPLVPNSNKNPLHLKPSPGSVQQFKLMLLPKRKRWRSKREPSR